MKNMFFGFGFLLLILFAGCSSNDSSVNPPSSNEKGNLSLKFDKTNAPANVVNVTAKLTRDGYTPVTGVLNIQSDTSAEITMSNINSGLWNLKVEASDSSNVVIYSGETTVNVLAGMITQVSLTLQPTGLGTGSINIVVSWGNPFTPTTGWLDYYLNPILRKGNNSYDSYGVWAPKVIIENNQYKMWYCNLTNNGVGCVGYAVSSDGLAWIKPLNTPVLLTGGPNSWDSHSVTPGPVIKVNNTYRMYYNGNSSNTSSWHIGLATSSDGLIWTKQSSPVLQAGSEYQISANDIILIDGVYHLYYSVINNSSYHICLATSSDGLSWTKYAQNPILTATKTWEGTGVYWPSVKYVNNKYYMVYQNANNSLTAFGFAYSQNGRTWTKDTNNPFFTNNDTYNHWVDYICYPELEILNNEWRIYYSCMLPSLERFVTVMRKM